MTTEIKMHSAEHLLNQTMVRMFGCSRCFSAHINRKKSKCDYKFDRMISNDEMEEIELRVNQIIRADLPVTLESVSQEKAQESYNIHRVPEGDELQELRIVHMGDYDSCPCIGTHVSSTAEIGAFRIISADFNDGVLRIRFKLS